MIVVSLSILIYIFGPVLKEETKYNFDKLAKVKYIVGQEETLNSFEKPLVAPNTDFSIVIPKIAAAAPVVPDVNSQDKFEYLKALRSGVAHAAGTAYPGEPGNVYLFAHSTDSFLNVNQYNAVFYLIGKLKAGDEIDIFYQGRLIKYEVTEKKVVAPDDVKYLGSLGDEKTLTLQTCYPPGTTLKRLIVVAKQVVTD